MRPLLLAAALSVVPCFALAATANVAFKGPEGQALGQAKLEEGPRGVLVRLELSGLKPGWHAIHFHAVGQCAGPAFTSAGGHVHTGETSTHGLLNPKGDDNGDLPNVFVGADGKAQADLFSTFVTLSGAEGRSNLKDADGSAMVIHEGPDDYATQPIGGAGARAACGAID